MGINWIVNMLILGVLLSLLGNESKSKAFKLAGYIAVLISAFFNCLMLIGVI